MVVLNCVIAGFWYGYNSIVITSWIGTLSNVVPAAIPPIVVGTLSVLV